MPLLACPAVLVGWDKLCAVPPEEPVMLIADKLTADSISVPLLDHPTVLSGAGEALYGVPKNNPSTIGNGNFPASRIIAQNLQNAC